MKNTLEDKFEKLIRQYEKLTGCPIEDGLYSIILDFISQELSTFAKEVEGIIDKEEDAVRIAEPIRMLTMLIMLKQIRQALTDLKKRKGIK